VLLAAAGLGASPVSDLVEVATSGVGEEGNGNEEEEKEGKERG